MLVSLTRKGKKRGAGAHESDWEWVDS